MTEKKRDKKHLWSPRRQFKKYYTENFQPKPVESFENTENYNSGYTVLETFVPTKSKETTKIEGNPDEIVEKLIDVLKNNVKVI